MDTLLPSLISGKPEGKAKYYLNDSTTLKKLKKAADIEDMTIISNIQSNTISFSTGAYINIINPLVNLWKDMQGHHIIAEDVDGMNIIVNEVEVEKEMAGIIVKYVVRLSVEGEKVTITCYDTTLSMFVQASQARLDEYCRRVLFPYLRGEIEMCQVRIKEFNDHVRSYGETRPATRHHKKMMRKGPAITEPPASQSTRKRIQNSIEPPELCKKARQGLLAEADKTLTPIFEFSPTRSNLACSSPLIRSALDPPALLELEYEELVAPARPSPAQHQQVNLVQVTPAAPVVLPALLAASKVQPAPIAAPKVLPAPLVAPKKQPATLAAPKVQPAPLVAPKVLPAPMVAPKVQPASLAPPKVQPALVAPKVQSALAAHKVQPALAPPEVQPARAAPEVQPALAAPEVQPALVAPEVQPALAAPEVLLALQAPEFMAEFVAECLTEALTLASPKQQEVIPAARAPPAPTAVCYPCSKCERVFTNPDEIRVHMQDEHISGEYKQKDSSLSASGRPIEITPNFGGRHSRFMKTIDLDNIQDTSIVDTDEEDELTPSFECNNCSFKNDRAETLLKHKEKEHPVFSCSVCGDSFAEIANLQHHILKNHCMQATGQVAEALKMHLQLLNTVLTNQTAIEHRLNSIALNQSGMATEINQIKVIQITAEAVRPPGVVSSTPPTPVPVPGSVSTFAERARPAAAQDLSQAPLQLQQAPRQQWQAPQQQLQTPQQQWQAFPQLLQDPLQQQLQAPLQQQLQAPLQQHLQAPLQQWQAPQQQQQAPRQIKKIAWVGDSISHHVDFAELEKVTKTKIKRRKAYGSVSASCQKFPHSNFTDVVPKELGDKEADILILQASSVDLTNIPADAPREYSMQQAVVSSENMITVAKSALTANPNIQKVIVMQTVDRYDEKHGLNKYAQQKLEEASKRANDPRIMIGKHNLECDGAIRASRFGDSRTERVDGVHLRGNSGMISYTRSVANILVAAGLTSEEEAALVGRNKNISFKKNNKEG